MTSDRGATGTLVVPAVLVTALCGGLVALQGRFNGGLADAGAGALVAAVVSYVGTLVTVALVLVVMGRAAKTARILRRDGRWWWYAVGLCAVPVVIGFATAIPVIGVALTSVCSVAGQTVAGLALDARGVGLPAPLRLTGRRLVAALVAIAGLAVAVAAGTGSGEVELGTALGLGLLLFVAGALLAGQQAGNGRVAHLAGDPIVPTLTSSAGGTLGALAVVAVAAAAGWLGSVALPGDTARWYLYLGGPLGTAITVGAAWAVRHLGTLALSLAVVGGQMATAVVIDLVGGVGVRWPTYVAAAMVTVATVLVVARRRASIAP